ncbi:MAG: GIY-YIG nuclease family protein [bacterium]|nr:GIY-YIG nuclease family protein [bacterium]
MFYYTYVLLCKKDNGFYVGYTDNIKRRVLEHGKGLVISTKNRRPLELVYFEGHKNKLMAMKREKYLKTGWGRNYLNKILAGAQVCR